MVLYYLSQGKRTGDFPRKEKEVYGRLLAFGEELEFRMDRERRLMRILIEPGMPVVVRIMTSGALRSEYGLEYGGFVVHDETNDQLLLETRLWIEPKGKPRHFPLNLGEDDMLYSTPIPALPERVVDFGKQPPRWMYERQQGASFLRHRATPAIPLRPIGYVLEAERARLDIRRPSRFQATIRRGF